MEHELNKYLEYLKIRNYSIQTITGYGGASLQFIRWINEYGKQNVNQVISEDLRRYLAYLQSKGHSRHGVDTLMRGIKSFFDYLEKQQMIFINPFEEIELPGLGDRSPKHILTEEEIKRLLALPNAATAKGLRNRAIMETLYSSAIRTGECIKLTMLDLDLENGFLKVNQGKNKKDRTVPLGKTACEYLKLYIEKIRSKQALDPDCKILFLSATNTPLKKVTLGVIIREYGRTLNLGKPVSPQSFRRAAVTHMLRNGANPVYLQRLLGHERLDTVGMYIKIAARDLKEAHKKHHPGERQHEKFN